MSEFINQPKQPKSLFNVFKKIDSIIVGFFSRMRVGLLSLTYFLHLWVRYLHDKTYERGGAYKRYTDQKYTDKVHKAIVTSFILSFAVFTIAQYLLPQLFNPFNPNKAEAATNSKTWTTQADFQSATTNSNIDFTTNQDSVSLPAAGYVWGPAPTTTNAPEARGRHTSVWTGSKLIVWGGDNGGTRKNTGGVYDKATDSWTATSTTNAPSARFSHTAVWTGATGNPATENRMIVWGGDTASGYTDTGKIYNPATNTWANMASGGMTRSTHVAVWTGSKMIIWGGTYITSEPYLYDPATDTWSTGSSTNAPGGRNFTSAVWTGATGNPNTENRMIVWGGYYVNPLTTGGMYHPESNTWTQTTTTNVPTMRSKHSAVWTGSKMIIWGGAGWSNALQNTGGVYDPATDSWSATSAVGLSARSGHLAIWDGSGMIIWGGV